MAVAAIAQRRTFPILLSSSQALTLSGDYSYFVGKGYKLKPLSDLPALLKGK
jgi:hypothetical protein